MSESLRSVAIVSTGRTATLFFARLFADHFPQVEAVHEHGLSRLINIATNAHLAGLLPLSAVIGVWRLRRGREVVRCRKALFVDSNPMLYGLIARAPELYPGLRVIHLVRDARAYVRSHLNWSRSVPRSYVANRFVPLWQPHPVLVGEMSLRRWLASSRFERFAWLWDYKNGQIERVQETGTPYMRLRFEDIFASEEAEEYLAEMLTFMGLPYVDGLGQSLRKRENISPQQSLPPWPQWSPARCRQLQAICGARMSRYGYGQEAAWRQRIEGPLPAAAGAVP